MATGGLPPEAILPRISARLLKWRPTLPQGAGRSRSRYRRLHCWRGGGNRLDFRTGALSSCRAAPGWHPARAYITSGNRVPTANRGFGLSLRNVSFRHLRCRENVKRVRHLHHHLSGARSIHFPAASQRLGPTHRARTAALRSVFGARRGAQPGDRQGRNAANGSGGNAATPGRAGSGGGRALEGHRRKRLGGGGRARCDRGGGRQFRCAAFHHRRARRLRDDRHHLCRGRSPPVAQSIVARGVRRFRCRDHRAGKPRRDRRDALCLDRRLDHHGGGAAQKHGADHRPLRLQARFLDARPQRHRDRRQRREGHRRHRCLDVRARRHLARSQLESGRDGSRTITPMALYCRAFCLFVLLVGLAGQSPAAYAAETEPIKFPDTQYEPAEWADVDGWVGDDHAAAFSTFLASCRVLTTTRQRSGRDASPVGDALKDVCTRALAAIPLDDDGARKFFEENFTPLRINKLGDASGFLTGYYEPIIEGSRVPTGEFTAPLYRRPPNLVVAGRRKLGPDAFPSKGVKVGRRLGRRKIVPYYDRGEIEDGALDGWHLEICWLHDSVDVLFAQIQGSARIRLEDGTILRVN